MDLSTAGVLANGVPVVVQAELLLDSTRSSPLPVTVTIQSNGEIVIGGEKIQGTGRDELMRRCEGLHIVRFLPLQPPSRLGDFLALADEDAPALAAAVRELMDDPQRRSRMGENARRFALNELDRDTVLGKFEAEILALCARPAGRTRATQNAQ